MFPCRMWKYAKHQSLGCRSSTESPISGRRTRSFAVKYHRERLSFGCCVALNADQRRRGICRSHEDWHIETSFFGHYSPKQDLTCLFQPPWESPFPVPDVVAIATLVFPLYSEGIQFQRCGCCQPFLTLLVPWQKTDGRSHGDKWTG